MTLQNNLLGLIPITTLQRVLQTRTVPSIQVLENAVRILQSAVVPRGRRGSGVLDRRILPLLLRLRRSSLRRLLRLLLLGARLGRRGREPGGGGCGRGGGKGASGEGGEGVARRRGRSRDHGYS